MDKFDEGRAWAQLDEEMTTPLDLVRWESASNVLGDQITRWGNFSMRPDVAQLATLKTSSSLKEALFQFQSRLLKSIQEDR